MPRRRSVRRAVSLALATAAALASVGAAWAAYLWTTLPDPAALARQNPRTTALIEQRRAEARTVRRAFRPRQAWVGLDRISSHLVNAVILSEDANFFGHEGFDWEAIRSAAESDLKAGRFARGASTLTQQLAKNLYLGTEKTLTRKAKEAVLAAKLERTLSKRRILALYLNVVELGDGVFGVEAGARARFGTSAAALTPAQAVVLASLLPAPRSVDLARPSRWLQKRARRLLDRLRDVGHLSDGAHLDASAELERILAGPAPADDRGDEEPPEDAQAPEPPPAEPRATAASETAPISPATPAATDATASPPPIAAPPSTVEPTAPPAPAGAPLTPPSPPATGGGRG
jgi:monofunctional biosynthetic peptidoglycan transglycosylase